MKTSNPKAKTARRFWSVLLSLVMALGMLPTAALAAEDDTEYDVVEGVQIADPDAAVEIAGMSIGLPLKVTVQQGGAKAPLLRPSNLNWWIRKARPRPLLTTVFPS